MNLNIILEKNQTIKKALEKLDKNKKRFLIVLDNERVIGTLTDGDIRRGFLRGELLHSKVESVYNKNFKYLTINSTFDEVCEMFRIEKIDFLPILDSDMKLLNVLTKKQFYLLLLEDIKFDILYDFSRFDEKILEHEIYNRPWGFYKSILLSPYAQAKVITVFPGEELSLQEHKKREEHWVIIKGKGKVILGESELEVYPGKYIYVPKGCKHQIINTFDENLIFSEVQLGEYFGEDDIIRYSDKYGRINKEKENK